MDFVEDRLGEWIDFRRDLHRHPELGFTEYRTQARIAERLEALGYRLRLGCEVMREEEMLGLPSSPALASAREAALANGARSDLVRRMGDGMTGLVAELSSGNGPVIAVRFDVDALPLGEARNDRHRPHRLGFASKHDGRMHACGHDGHATIGIAFAEIAAREPRSWSGTLRLVFQPAEEGGRGAWPMVAAGVVDDVDLFLALHLGCDLSSRKVAVSASDMMFSSKWDIHFEGRSAHASGNPEEGRNALLAAAQATTLLYALPRHGRFATQVNVGRLNAGSARNIIANSAGMEIEIRGGAEEALEHMEKRARSALEGIALAQGCEMTLREMGRTIGEASSAKAMDFVRRAAKSMDAFDEVRDSWPLGGGDDAAYFMRRVKERGGEAAYFILGSDLAGGHHATTFDFEEADIARGARLLLTALELASAHINSITTTHVK
jgi:aminobenzoyl-glutamate utilization protein A